MAIGRAEKERGAEAVAGSGDLLDQMDRAIDAGDAESLASVDKLAFELHRQIRQRCQRAFVERLFGLFEAFPFLLEFGVEWDKDDEVANAQAWKKDGMSVDEKLFESFMAEESQGEAAERLKFAFLSDKKLQALSGEAKIREALAKEIKRLRGWETLGWFGEYEPEPLKIERGSRDELARAVLSGVDLAAWDANALRRAIAQSRGATASAVDASGSGPEQRDAAGAASKKDALRL